MMRRPMRGTPSAHRTGIVPQRHRHAPSFTPNMGCHRGDNTGRAMPIYRAPVDDFRFVLNELLELDKQRDLPGYADVTPDLVEDILTNAAKFCEEVLQPINQSGDEEGAHFENGVVRTPKGFKEAYKQYSEAG